MGYEGFDIGPGLNNLNTILAQGYRDRMALQQAAQQQQLEFQKSAMADQRARELQVQALAEKKSEAQLNRENLRAIAGMKGDASEGKHVDSMLEKLKNDVDPYRPRSGLAPIQKMINAGERVDKLFTRYPDYNVPKAQSVELASTVAALISGGSIQSQHQLDAITPASYRGDAQAIAGWLTNEPLGLQQQAFMKALHDTAKAEKEMAIDQKYRAIIPRLAAHASIRDADPSGYEGILKANGITPEILQKYSGDPNISQALPKEGPDPALVAKVNAWAAKKMAEPNANAAEIQATVRRKLGQ